MPDQDYPFLVKLCGMRDPANIETAGLLPIDFMGFIFAEKSPRFVKSADTARAASNLPSSIKKTGVFVDSTLEDLYTIQEVFALDVLQLHGNETVWCCQEAAKVAKVFKAFSIHPRFDFETIKPYEEYCDAFVFDAKGENKGGNGVKYDWALLEKYKGETPFLLSGGIGPGDVAALQSFRHPKFMGIDINSLFETAPGLKDIGKTASFLNQLFEFYKH